MWVPGMFVQALYPEPPSQPLGATFQQTRMDAAVQAPGFPSKVTDDHWNHLCGCSKHTKTNQHF